MAEDASSASAALAAGPAPTPLPPLSVVPLSPFPPAFRRLSMSGRLPATISAADPRRLSWLSLQGMLVGAEEAASSVAFVGAGLSGEQSVAWELFTPMQRVLIVTIVAVAAADLSRRRRVSAPQRPVQIREEIFTSMQQKLDYLCEEMNSLKDQKQPPFSGCDIARPGMSNCSCGYQSSQLDRPSLDFKDEVSWTNHGDVVKEEHEERRMSGLSDWNSSITSSSEIQLNALAVDQDVYDLEKDCEAMDTTIKGLVDIMKCSDAASSKRISDSENVIKRKNLLITKLRKDVVILEQKVLQLTRLQRPSYLQSTASTVKPPLMASNLLYDMESSSGPSDSDSPPSDAHKMKTITSCQNHKENEIVDHQTDASLVKSHVEKSPKFSLRAANGHVKKQAVNPLREGMVTQKSDSSVLSKSRQLASLNGDLKKITRRKAPGLKNHVSQVR